MTVRAGRLGIGLLALGLAFGLGQWTARETPRERSPAPVCRPSAPQLAADHDGMPIVLFLGNSLIFDHGWRIGGALAANCARQGLLARDAPALVAALPGMTPGMAVLGFGSVEALQAAQAGLPVDPAGFGEAMRAVTGAVRARWPGIPVVWLSIPGIEPGPLRPGDVAALNGVLGALAAADPDLTLLDVDRLPATGPGAPGPVSYDGVHMAGQTYGGWERAISALFAAR